MTLLLPTHAPTDDQHTHQSHTHKLTHIDTHIHIFLPSRFTRGPPELPALMAASVCDNVGVCVGACGWMGGKMNGDSGLGAWLGACGCWVGN